MNSDSEQFYEKNKANYKNIEFLSKNKQQEIEGTRNLFLKLLEYIEKNDIETRTLTEINDIWRRDKK